MDELKQYEIAGKALQEMLDSHSEKSESKREDKKPEVSQLGKALHKILGEALLKEMGPYYDEPYDPYEGCPLNLKKLQKLVRFIDRTLNDYMELYHIPRDSEPDIQDDLRELLGGSLKVVLSAAIAKMGVVWAEKEGRVDISSDPTVGHVEVEIIPQTEVRSPRNEIFVVNEVVGDTATVISKITKEKFAIKLDALKKWKKV